MKRCSLVACLILLLFSSMGFASSIPPKWEELVERADFFGEVECIQAGQLVAKFRVIHSWYGIPKGTEQIMELEPRFYLDLPMALQGDRWVILSEAGKTGARQSRFHRPNPVYLRDFPAEQKVLFMSKPGFAAENLQATHKAPKGSLAEINAQFLEIKKSAATQKIINRPIPEILLAEKQPFPEVGPSGALLHADLIFAARDHPDQLLKLLLAGSYPEAAGYTMASYYCHHLRKNRRTHLKQLLSASDPYVQAAGAIYLFMEEEGEGKAALSEKMKLADDAGAWAALALARRGEVKAMDRALSVLEFSASNSLEGGVRRFLQQEVLVLLSNSARSSNVDPPPAFAVFQEAKPEQNSAQWKAMEHWWHAHRQKIILKDPWVKGLESQQID